MKKYYLFFSLFLTGLLTVKAQSVMHLRTDSVGNYGEDRGYAIAIDDSGNVYTSGWFYSTVDFDPGPGIFNLTSAGGRDVYVTKRDNSGNFIWAKSAGGASDDYCFSMSLDNSGNVYTTGGFSFTSDFDPGPGVYNLYSSYKRNVFIWKISKDGDLIWVKSFEGSGSSQAYGISVDNSGYVYTSGNYEDTVDFDPGLGVFTLLTPGMRGLFISKLDPSGQFIWAKNICGSAGAYSLGITTDNSGNSISTGYFCGTQDFDPGPGTYNLSSPGYSGVFVCKLNPSGSLVWAGSMNTTSMMSSGFAVTTDQSDNIFTTGYIDDNAIDMDPGPGVFILSKGAFISKLGPSGNFVWARQLGSGATMGYGITLDNSGNIYSTGTFRGIGDFDPGPGVYELSTSSLTNDIYISKLDPSGNFKWAKNIGTPVFDFGQAIAVDSNENVFINGYSHLVNGWSSSTIINSVFCQMERPVISGLSNVCDGDTILLSCSEQNSYFWNTGAVSQSITVSDSGTYYVLSLNESGCSAISEDFYVTADPCTGVHERESAYDIQIYPNPATGNVNISMLKEGCLSICDIAGAEVKMCGLIKGSNPVNLEMLSSGIYFLKISTGENGNVSAVKLIKQ
jgi:hypothetical protein